MISQKLLDEFKELFREKYGVQYTDAEAREAAENLTGFFEVLLKIDRRTRYRENEKNK